MGGEQIMNDYIKKLKDTIKLYENLKVEAESAYTKNYDAVPDEVNPRTLECKINYYKAILTVYEYYLEKGDLMFGKYISASMSFCGDKLGFNLYLEDSETEDKLYDCVFGSHSGINIFVQNHFPDIFSLIMGTTGYSSDFGCFDFERGLDFFKNFGYIGDSLCWDQKELDRQIDQAKKILDWFFKLSENTELMNDVDKILTTYFEIVFKHNQEE
jgi:hypothetical protein